MAPAIVDVTEQKRLNEAREAQVPWKKWGPYLSERQWGTVRVDPVAETILGHPLSAPSRYDRFWSRLCDNSPRG